MDLLTCAGISILEALLIDKLQSAAISPSFVTRTAVLFAAQYLALKYYRIFLYHKYFSPLRHLPGPKVGLPCVDTRCSLTNVTRRVATSSSVKPLTS
jgi:hypothetical protein